MLDIYMMVYEFGWCSQNMHGARCMSYGLPSLAIYELR